MLFPIFGEVNWTNISGNWSDFILTGYNNVLGNWFYPLAFMGIVGYIYCINRSAMSAAAAICIIFGVYGVTNVFAAPDTMGFSLFGWIVTIFSFSGLFTLLFIRSRRY